MSSTSTKFRIYMAAVLGVFLLAFCLAPDRKVASEQVVAKPTRAVVEEIEPVSAAVPKRPKASRISIEGAFAPSQAAEETTVSPAEVQANRHGASFQGGSSIVIKSN